MNKLLRTIATALTLLLICLPLSVGAAETQSTEVSPYVVTQTDLENATGTMATPDDTTDSVKFGLYDSGEADHGMVYVIESAGWAAVTNGNTGIKYTYNSNEYTLFDEPVENDTYYILSYDHKSFPTDSSSLNSVGDINGRFFLAPPVDVFKTSSGTDYRDCPPASDNAWSTHSVVFNSQNLTNLDTKINTAATNTKSYIDNIKLVKATQLDVSNPGGSELSLDGTGLIYSEKLKGYFAEMGKPITIKAEDDESYEGISEVTHGGEVVEAVDGVYTIPSVTGEVKVTFGLKIEEIEAEAGVTLKNGNVYTDCGGTYAKLLSKFGMPKNVIEFYNADGEKQTDFLKPMVPNATAKVVYDGEKLRDYNIKYYGDVLSDGELKVSDIITLIDGIVSDTVEDTVQADVNGSKLITVSDVVKLRRMIMEQGQKEVNQFKVLAIGNSFSIDATTHLAKVANAAGYEVEDIVVGNVWYSGCSLEQHADYAKNDSPSYNFYYWKNSLTAGSITNATLKTALQYEDWDYIMIQQVSQDAGRYSTFQPYATELLQYINEHKLNPDLKIGWHMTWAYPQTPPEGYGSHQGFAYYDSDQLTMYNAIVDASTNFASIEQQIELVAPVGTAIQNLRAKVGDVVTRDQFHLNESYARLTASLTWVKAISGKDLDAVRTNEAILDIVNTGVTDLAARGVTITAEELLDYVIESANDAVANPSSITE